MRVRRLIPHNDYQIHVMVRLGRPISSKERNLCRRNNTNRIPVNETVRQIQEREK